MDQIRLLICAWLLRLVVRIAPVGTSQGKHILSTLNKWAEEALNETF